MYVSLVQTQDRSYNIPYMIKTCPNGTAWSENTNKCLRRQLNEVDKYIVGGLNPILGFVRIHGSI